MEERDYRTYSNSGSRDEQGGRLGRLFGRDSRSYDSRASQTYTAGGSAAGAYSGGYSSGGVIINSPKTYEDVQLLIDHLKLREQVIVDFSAVNQASVYRILDFMSGAIYALGGSIQPITKNIFLFAPAGVTITIPPQFTRK
ncbi:MAG: cell division protein SepF [Clostridiales bacterium]|nr:cell division protein SepF [Clostridiales bacterium]